MYIIRIKEIRTGEISFDTLEEAKQWYEDREGDVYWYYEYGDKSLHTNYVLTTEDITRELNW